MSRVLPLIGMGGDRLLPQVTGGLSADSDEGSWIAKRRMEIFLERELPLLRPTAGARELLAAVRARGGRVVVATSAKREELEKILAVGAFAPLVDVVTTSDDAPASKPAPDIVERALDKAGVTAHEAVMVGDTRYDIESAKGAGVACIALLCGGNEPASLTSAQAVYADPLELTAELDREPFNWARSTAEARAAGARST